MNTRAPAPAPDPKAERQRRERRGRAAERLCRTVLRIKGYRILAYRYRCPAGEIDIVARRGGTVALVEVKARPDAAAAGESVPQRQWLRVHAAARFFVARHPYLQDTALRFDLMLVTPWRWPRHLTNAWQPDDQDALRF